MDIEVKKLAAEICPQKFFDYVDGILTGKRSTTFILYASRDVFILSRDINLCIVLTAKNVGTITGS